MPLEIRELIIKATVDDKNKTVINSNDAEEGSETNINEIVGKVLDIIKQKSER
jgi:hypothetical protein